LPHYLSFTLANIGVPGLSNFVGEMLCFIAIFERNFFVAFLAVGGTLFGVGYSMWLANRLLFGPLRVVLSAAYHDLTLVDLVNFYSVCFLDTINGYLPEIIPRHVLCLSVRDYEYLSVIFFVLFYLK
jgi:NADH-quinone oxidoreductase subunit M